MTKDTSDPTHGGRPPSRQLPPVAWAAPAPLKSVPPKLAPRKSATRIRLWWWWVIGGVALIGAAFLVFGVP